MHSQSNSHTDSQKWAACVEYDGSNFSGWQRQCGQASVQAALEHALGEVAADPTTVVAAGRTDTGVHACGQVVHFQSRSRRSNWGWTRGANSNLPAAAAVVWVKPVAAEFHARYSATERRYRYVLLNRRVRPTYLRERVTWDYRELNVEAMRVAAATLLGRHDFSAFRASACQAKSPIRTLRLLHIDRSGDWIWLDVAADGFLHHMIRNLVGSLLAVGAGERRPEWIADVLQGADRRRAGITAPAHGLYLTGVEYPAHFALPPPPAACRFW